MGGIEEVMKEEGGNGLNIEWCGERGEEGGGRSWRGEVMVLGVVLVLLCVGGV